MSLYNYTSIYCNAVITPIYQCRNCTKVYSDAKQELPDTPLEGLVPTARFTFGSQDHVFRIGEKTIQVYDLHLCNEHDVGIANFFKVRG